MKLIGSILEIMGVIEQFNALFEEGPPISLSDILLPSVVVERMQVHDGNYFYGFTLLNDPNNPEHSIMCR